jgi:tetratricopeptide (TPR) repeat protein
LVNFMLGHFAEALADIAKAVELNPEDLSNLRNITLSQVAACPDESFRAGLLELADKSIELTDKAARAYAARGEVLAALGHEERAFADLKTAFDTIPITTERSELNRSATCQELGYLCGELAHRQDMIPYLVRMAELQPKETIHSYRAALTQLGAGQPDSYRETCRNMLQQFQDTEAPAYGYWVARTCALAPDAVEDYAPVMRLAEQAVKGEPDPVISLNAMGAILYRAGKFKEAIERLTDADNLIEEPDTESKHSPTYTWYL